MPTAYLSLSRLRELADVSSSTPGSSQDSNPLVWNNTSGLWEAGVVPRVNGLRFPDTQVANGDPNTLDDYEEAVFNPILIDGVGFDISGSGYTYDFSSGFYTKTGNICTYAGFIGVTQKPDRASDRNMLVSIPFFGKSTWTAEAQITPNSVAAYNSSWSIGSCGPRKTMLYADLYKSVSFSSGTELLTLADIQTSPLPTRIIFSFSYLTN